jgi:hypothetical protein
MGVDWKGGMKEARKSKEGKEGKEGQDSGTMEEVFRVYDRLRYSFLGHSEWRF